MNLSKINLKLGVILISMLVSLGFSPAQQGNLLALRTPSVVSPFDEVVVASRQKGNLTVTDGKGNPYYTASIESIHSFRAAGALGSHRILLHDRKGRLLAHTSFVLDAQTSIDDGGEMAELFDIFRRGLFNVGGGRGYGRVTWNGEVYRYYVPWDLDHNSVLNGMQYFLPYGGEFTDLLRETQRDDGMIWSFVMQDDAFGSGSAYYETAYSSLGFFRRDDDIFFARQPVDNHSDYNYVNQFYKHWKASGNGEWMKRTLESAIRALDYCYTDTLRWSQRFHLLKRPYCIDSWDFQVMDEYTPEGPISPTMLVIPGKTKFGIFFGDNTGYFEACNQVAEMLEYTGDSVRAAIYRERGRQILENLIRVSWNGRFFTHFVEDDPTVVRNLGVDESTQIAQGNMYSLNRGLPLEVNRAIIETYKELRENLPQGSPGEWYAIYPPFGRGFEGHGAQWQYMNGGVAGHAIGEMARGAFESGYEDYASDVLKRTLALARRHNNRLYFSYTGMIPDAPPPPSYTPIDIARSANMDLWGKGEAQVFKWMNERGGENDMRGLPTGLHEFEGIPFQIADPEVNRRSAAIGVSYSHGFPQQVDIPVGRVAGSLYLLHSVSGVGPSNVAGAISLLFEDGTSYTRQIMNNRDITGWWFPSLKAQRSGVAWYGPNPVSTSVGVCWVAIDNPNPDKRINAIRIHAPLESGIYAVLGITLADAPHNIPVSPISYGGPDNWTSGNGMGALVEGLAGVQNMGLAFDHFRLTPRWLTAGKDSANVTIRFAASDGYVAYRYLHNPEDKSYDIALTSSGDRMLCDLLIPSESKVREVTVNGIQTLYTLRDNGAYSYISFNMNVKGITRVNMTYE